MQQIETCEPTSESATFGIDILVIDATVIMEPTANCESHPHDVHIYSLLDERDHRFAARDKVRVSELIAAFYREVGLSASELDFFKCEASGQDIALFSNELISDFRRRPDCDLLTWIFSRCAPVIVQVNSQEITFHRVRATGAEIKATAIAQGVAIKQDFCLFLLNGGRQEPIRDDQVVCLRSQECFDAVDPDHCS